MIYRKIPLMRPPYIRLPRICDPQIYNPINIPNIRPLRVSQQTYEGFKIEINSITEAGQFLIQRKVSYVLMESFCQEPLENYFGHQNSLEGRKDDPSLRDFGFNDNAIRNQKVFRSITSNVRGQDQNNIEFSCEPISCRKKAKMD